MKKLFTLLILAACLFVMGNTADAQLFQQDFSSSTTVSNYTNASPTNGQFNGITTSGAGTVLSINTTGSNKLRFARTGNAGAYTRTTDFSPTPSSLMYRFDITMSGNSSATTTAATFQVGSGFTSSNTAETGTNVHSRLGLNVGGTAGQFSLRDIGAGTNTTTYSGTQTVTWVINNSGGSITYKAPDGTFETLADDRFDLWVGNTKEFNDANAQTASQTLTDIKFVMNGGVANVDFDNFLIDPIPSVPTSSAASNITSSGFRANWTAVTGATGYRLDVSTSNTFASFVTGYNDLYVSGQATNFLDVTGLSSNTQYYYRLRTAAQYTVGEFASNNSSTQSPTTSSSGTAPSVQASAITFSSVTSTGMTIGWTNGDGAKRLVIMNTSNSFTNPTDGQADPSANTTYSGSGEQVIYNNTSNSVSITGLSALTTYWFRVYEYNGTGATSLYLTTTASNNPRSRQTPGVPPTLTAAVGATVDGAFVVTFADDPTWRADILGITVNGVDLTAGYNVTAGQITFTPSASSPANLLQQSGSKNIAVITANYSDATVTQSIGAGADNKLGISIQPAAPSTNGAVLGTQPVVLIQDQYGNTTTSTANVVASVGAGTWSLGGTTTKAGVNGTATFTDLTATSAAFVNNATISFTSGVLTGVTSGTFNIPAPVTEGLQVSAADTRFLIDFDNTVSGVNNGKFTGAGITTTASTTGQLNSNSWACTGMSDGTLNFGGTGTSADFTNGVSTGGVTTGGMYAFTVATSNNAIGFQPTGSDWEPGTLTLKIQNKSGSTATSLSISYIVYVYNDGGRSSNFNFSHSADNNTYTSVGALDLLSTVTADAGANLYWKAYVRTTTITGLSIGNNGFYYVKWSGSAGSGSGTRDEFALDDISVVLNPSSVTSGISGTFRDVNLNANTTLTGSTTISGTLNLTSSTLTVGANTLTISGNTPTRTSGAIDASNSSAIVTFANSSAITLPTGLFTGNIGNLRMNSSNFVTSTDNITVSNTLTLDNGWLRMGSNTLGILTIGTSTSNLGSIVRNGGGQVNGSIRRWVDNSTGARIFPVGFYHWVTGSGYANDYVEYNLNFTSAPASGGTITVRFDTTGSGTLPETDPTGHPNQYYIPFSPNPGVNLINLTPQYWTVSTDDGFDIGVTGRYSLDLTLNGMGVSTTAYQYTAIVKRTNNTQPWAVDFTNNYIQTTNPSGNTPLAHGHEFDSFSEFAIAGNMDNLLPVELTSFTASIDRNASTLNWSTVSEENNSGFDIERKSGTGSWSKIGFVEGHGTVNTPSSYIYTDRNLVSGKYNYRLKQIDFNGNYKYYELSNEVIIGTPTKYALSQNFPNPFNPSTTISYEIPASNFVSLKIYDMMGKEVANLVNATQEAGFYTVKFDASKLASGVYFYKLQANDFTATKKLMLMK